MSKGAALPRPKGHWLLGNLPEFRRDRLGTLTDWAHRYGDMVDVRLGPRRFWLLNHPDLIEEVLVTRNRAFTKHFALRIARGTLGDGLLTSEGDFWRRQRKLAQPAFHRDRVASYADVMVRYAEDLAASWRDGEVRDVHADMMLLTLRIVAKTLFDADVEGDATDVSEAMETLLRNFTRRVNRLVPVPAFVPTPSNVRYRIAMRKLERVLFRIIAERRAGGEDRGDLLSMLLQAQDEEDGTGMTDRQLRDETMTLFLAGHETTANALTWAWYLLADHPEVEDRFHTEIDTVCPDRPPTFADLPRLTYTDQIVTETLRVYPTVWVLGREAVSPVEVGGRDVPLGTTMWMSQWVVHRDPRWYDQPDEFLPKRWSDGLMERLPRYAYFPFGGGPRICIGNRFAQMEAVLVLATLGRRFRLLRAQEGQVRPLPTMTLRPDGPMPMRVASRTRAT
jgi:cytochrome P450